MPERTNMADTDSTGRLDQMLFREPSRVEPAPPVTGSADGKSVADRKSGKSFKEPVPPTKPKLSEQGLYFFSLFTYAPKYNNILPFYFHTGLVYRGLIPTRDNDLLMAVFGLGQYSSDNIEALQASGNVNQPNYTAVLGSRLSNSNHQVGILSAVPPIHHSAEWNRSY